MCTYIIYEIPSKNIKTRCWRRHFAYESFTQLITAALLYVKQMLYMTYAFVYVMCVWNDFSDRNERPQTGDNGRCESITQVAVDLLRDRQH